MGGLTPNLTTFLEVTQAAALIAIIAQVCGHTYNTKVQSSKFRAHFHCNLKLMSKLRSLIAQISSPVSCPVPS